MGMAEGRGEGLSWPRLSSSLSPLPSPSRRSHQLELRDTTEAPLTDVLTWLMFWYGRSFGLVNVLVLSMV